MAMAASGTRDGRGRFVPGMSGNPAGKKPGTLNKATLWRQAMAEGDELEGRRKVVRRMVEGDLRAAMFVLRQIDGPDRKVAALALPIPPGSDVATVFGSIKAKMILGEVSPDEALAWFTALEKGVKAVTDQLEQGDVDRRMDAASAVAAAAEATAAAPASSDDGGPWPEPGRDGGAADEPAPVAPATSERATSECATSIPAAAEPDAPVPLVAQARTAAGAASAPPPVSACRVTGADGRDEGAAAALRPSPTPRDADRSTPPGIPAAAPAPNPAAVAPPVTPAPRAPQPCISPAFPGRRRSIVAARTAAEEAARRAAVPPPVQPVGDREPGLGG